MDGDAALVRAVRALDQGSIDTTPDKLERVWKALSQHRGQGAKGGFHAADEMLLRWLLKNMIGSTPAAERLRRYPPAWDIMGAVFDWIPLFSLAKSLADRRFVAILQQTLKDISKAQNTSGAADSDVEMVDAPPPASPQESATTNSRKRKRSMPVTFDLALQRQATGCLQAAEAVLAAIQTLLARCESTSTDGAPNHRMGAEHVKSLFSSSATEVMEVLVPLLTLCNLAVENTTQEEPLKDQSSWMSILNSLWDLHLQSASDAVDVATHVSGLAANLLGKLTGVPQQRSLTIDATVQQRWARDLRRFLTRNMILPSRSAFLNKGGQEIMKVAVDMSALSFTTSFPVLFDLISKSTRVFGNRTSKKDYETWIQAVFDALLQALGKTRAPKQALAVEAIIGMAAERESPLSLASLRSVCKDYALQDDSYNWQLLLSIVKLNPDTFLLTSEGQALLGQVLEKTRNSESMTDEDFDKALQFTVLLAEGYARTRDLSTFLKIWLSYIAVAEPKVKLERLWTRKELVFAVASLLQESLNTNQLLDILEWLASRTESAESLGRIHILAAISSGVSDNDLIDVINMKTFNAVFLENVSKKEPAAISVSRWLVAEHALSRGTHEECTQIWSRIKSDLERVLRKSGITKEGTFAAFKCCLAAWLANHPYGADEEEAASMACSFFDRFEKDSEESESNESITKGTYVSWILSGTSRLVSLITKRKKTFPKFILSLILLDGVENVITYDTAMAIIPLILENENDNNDEKLIHDLTNKMISLLDPSKAAESLEATRIAVQFLLGVPSMALTRQQRETAMERLVSQLSQILDMPGHVEVEYWKPALSLMGRLMEQSTFYPDMSFKHLDTIGRRLYKLYRQSKEKWSSDSIMSARADFLLLARLASLCIRQMDSGNPEEREKAYIADAVSVLQSPCKDSDAVPRIILLHTFISTVQSSPTFENLKEGGLDLDNLKIRLLQGVKSIITAGKWRGRALLSLLTALRATDVFNRPTVKQNFSSAVPSLIKASQKLLAKNSQAGWEVRMFLARCFVEELGSPLKIKFHRQTLDGEDEEEGMESVPDVVDQDTISQYVEVAVRDVDDETKLKYLEELLHEGSEDNVEAVSRLYVVKTLLQHITNARPAALSSASKFDLALTHSLLCKRLSQTETDGEQFHLIAEALVHLLDHKAAHMTQWNIDLTLSTVSTTCCSLDKTLSSQKRHRLSTRTAITTTLPSASSPKTYRLLCALMEIIIKRHRRRLDGHFHLLIAALQSLLRHLLLLSSSLRLAHDTGGRNNTTADHPIRCQKQQATNARLFSRLLTLICEPTVASVTRHHSNTTNTEGGGNGPSNVILDSEKDRAKRYAGQYMCLVVMHYIRLQLQLEQTVVVTGEVREAIERGMFSVLDITTKPDGLHILTDAMDGSGRVIFRELYKRYKSLGKWTGV
ncbi:Urb2/Npa2 family-domain-containing protein [Apodospora peruviana]|uniref:Urb2/Npa2 family-domain-containing protein n=1 Tax=Apodospora peruviana TaxID=516989 RepID=A0AAE0LZV1_9PEZI|nr:Urb2/Npa2 family-domain-containing protein [Apodospora peruviana]